MLGLLGAFFVSGRAAAVFTVIAVVLVAGTVLAEKKRAAERRNHTILSSTNYLLVKEVNGRQQSSLRVDVAVRQHLEGESSIWEVVRSDAGASGAIMAGRRRSLDTQSDLCGMI